MARGLGAARVDHDQLLTALARIGHPARRVRARDTGHHGLRCACRADRWSPQKKPFASHWRSANRPLRPRRPRTDSKRFRYRSQPRAGRAPRRSPARVRRSRPSHVRSKWRGSRQRRRASAIAADARDDGVGGAGRGPAHSYSRGTPGSRDRPSRAAAHHRQSRPGSDMRHGRSDRSNGGWRVPKSCASSSPTLRRGAVG